MARQSAYAAAVDIDERFYPYRTTPARIALDAADAIASSPGVTRVALIGPIADGRQDGHAVIDLLAAVTDDSASVAASAALHEALPLRYYYPLPDSPAPSGAYWLEGESPFHRVEVEFTSGELFDVAVKAATAGAAGIPDGGSAMVNVVEARPAPVLTSSSGLPDTRTATQPRELALGAALIRALDAMAEYLRGRAELEPARLAMTLLDEAYEAVGHPKRTPAGHIGDLVSECRALWQTLYLAHLRAESGIEVRDPEGLSG